MSYVVSSSQYESDDDVPWGFICPISQSIMTDPVCTLDGHSYERATIQSWFLQQQQSGMAAPLSPLTGEKLPSFVLVTNHNLRGIIEDFLRRNPHVARHGYSIPRVSPEITPTILEGVASLGFSQVIKGKYVELEDLHIATRTVREVSWVDTLTFVQRPMRLSRIEEHLIELQITETTTAWGGPVFGIAPCLPSPARQRDIENFLLDDCWRIDGQGWFHRPNQEASELVGWQTSLIEKLDRITIHVTKTGTFILAVNGEVKVKKPCCDIPTDKPLYVFAAVFGTVEQIVVTPPTIPVGRLRGL